MEFNTIDEYIIEFPDNIKEILNKVRKTISETAPTAKEKISWRMPTFYLNGNLIHFAAHKSHVGIYPGPEAIIEFKDELKNYETSRGAIQFPFSKPIPYDLIKKIVEFNIKNRNK
jgi:uncharacterized protein YdhG (YjbR/CyaY superfamily)